MSENNKWTQISQTNKETRTRKALAKLPKKGPENEQTRKKNL